MYTIFDITSLGSLVFAAYIIIDFIRNKINQPKEVIRRLFFYSFIFYLINLAQITTGGIVFPPQKDFGVKPQLIPFYFIFDWLVLYQRSGFDWFFWNSVKLSFYNFVMLIPLGIYLSLIFKQKNFLKVILIVFLVSLLIESSQLVFGYLGFIRGREFDVDDLILNTFGGFIGFLFIEFSRKITKMIFNHEKRNQNSFFN